MKENPDIYADKNASDIGSENLNAEQIELQKQKSGQGVSKGKEGSDKGGQKKNPDWNKKSGKQGKNNKR